jgi:hypothetical protein
VTASNVSTRLTPATSVRNWTRSLVRVYLDIPFYRSSPVLGEAHKFKNAEEVSEYIDNLVRNSDCAGHPTVDLFNFRLIMPTDVFDEKEFLLMKAICDVQDLECVRGTDDNDI